MENASKALLIAAAVLVVILIIAFGMQIMNSSTGTTEQVGSTMSSSEVQAFNSQFNGFKGTQKGAAIRNLIIAVTNSNTKNPSHKVTLTGDVTTLNGLTSYEDTNGEKAYTVKFTYDDGETNAQGYITEIDITAK